jgi:peptidyl-Lys metalloendopeptidase
MNIFLRCIIILVTAISLQVNAANPQLNVQVNVANMENGDVNATLTITNNGNSQ